MTTEKPISAEQAERLIDFLADKTLSRNCVIERHGERMVIDFHTENGDVYIRNHGYFSRGNVLRTFKILGHNILLGDILQKLKVNIHFQAEIFTRETIRFVNLWWECGIDRSLQDIAKDNTEASNALLQFLISIFLTEEQ
jgi:hypothetical protein